MAGQSAARRRLILPPGLLASVRIVGGMLVYLAVLTAVLVLTYGLSMQRGSEAVQGWLGLIDLGVAEAAALGSVLLLWRLWERHRVRKLGLDRGMDPGPRWLRGAVIAALMIAFVVLVGYTLIDGATWSLNPNAPRAAVVLLGGLLGYLIQGPAEEVLFRGYVLEIARQQWGARWAVAISAVAFALIHTLNPSFGWLPLLNLLLFGLGTALYRLNVDDGQLWGVFGIHTCWNWLQQVVFGLPNSGTPLPAADTLVSVVPNTTLPEPLWGGGFGPEGTLLATIALAVLVAYSLRRGRSPPETKAA